MEIDLRQSLMPMISLVIRILQMGHMNILRQKSVTRHSFIHSPDQTSSHQTIRCDQYANNAQVKGNTVEGSRTRTHQPSTPTGTPVHLQPFLWKRLAEESPVVAPCSQCQQSIQCSTVVDVAWAVHWYPSTCAPQYSILIRPETPSPHDAFVLSWRSAQSSGLQFFSSKSSVVRDDYLNGF